MRHKRYSRVTAELASLQTNKDGAIASRITVDASNAKAFSKKPARSRLQADLQHALPFTPPAQLLGKLCFPQQTQDSSNVKDGQSQQRLEIRGTAIASSDRSIFALRRRFGRHIRKTFNGPGLPRPCLTVCPAGSCRADNVRGSVVSAPSRRRANGVSLNSRSRRSVPNSPAGNLKEMHAWTSRLEFSPPEQRPNSTIIERPSLRPPVQRWLEQFEDGKIPPSSKLTFP